MQKHFLEMKIFNMKNTKISLNLILVFTLLLSTKIAHAEAETNWEQIFSNESVKSQSYLGTQCKFETPAEYRDYLKTQTDPDLKTSHESFTHDLQMLGIQTAPYELMAQKPETKYICYMTANEYLALSLYTGAYYQQINAALRKLDLQQLKNYRLLIKFLIAGLSKIKDYVGVTKRGTNLKSETIGHCKANAAFADRGFLSTSVGAGFGGNYRFVLASKSCKYIASFSRFPDEEEVLCLPGTVFQIGYFEKKPTGTQVVLVEVGQTFNIDDLIQTLEENPELQNPNFGDNLAQSCQPNLNKIE
jgi:hypothetical protein